jgi:hypothetical protein
VFRFTLSEPATIRISFSRALAGRHVAGRCRPPRRSLRRRPRCTRYAGQGSLIQARTLPGVQRVTFKGRVGRRSLKPGLHRATLVATDLAGNRSRALRVTFRVVRRR